MKNLFLTSLVAIGLSSAVAFAADTGKGGPCKEIKQACETAGFKPKTAKEGTGLWVDCIDPIMQGKAQPASAKIKLPTVGADVVAACKAKRPNFGEGKGMKK